MKAARAALALMVAALAGCGDDSSEPNVDPPTLTALSPAQGTVGTEVRIDGTGFSNQVKVRFDNLESPRVIRQGGSLYALAPAGVTAGRQYAVHVLNDGVRADTATLMFTAIAPDIDRVNGVTRPTGLRGMTLILEGSAFSDSVGMSQARVYFSGPSGTRLPAVIADPGADWADRFVVTSVPQEVGDVSWIWMETPTGVSDSVEFRIIQSGLFSPSLINWTRTTDLPQALQALAAVFVPIEDGPAPANWVYVTGGADTARAPVTRVLRVGVQQNAALAGSWQDMPALPAARAYHATAAATPFTAAIDTATTGAFLYVLGGLDAAGQPSTSAYFAKVELDGTVQPWQSTRSLPAALRSPSATVFAGWMYLVGGADAQGMAVRSTWRAPINEDGTIGAWQAMTNLPGAAAHSALVSFGPFLYSLGGETQSTAPTRSTQSGSETSNVYLARVDLRSRNLSSAGWTQATSMGKARSKHGAIFAGGSILVTSGIYAGNPGSSENTYAGINSDGTLNSWNGATGSETIDVELGMSLYNQAVVTFIDASGFGHVLVIGGADRAVEGKPSAGVVRY
jgi:N-acetylneuraminic acid mutarotase